MWVSAAGVNSPCCHLLPTISHQPSPGCVSTGSDGGGGGVRQELGDGFITAGSGQREVFDCGSHMDSEWSELESGYWMIWYLKPSRTGSKVLMTLGKIFFWAPC